MDKSLDGFQQIEWQSILDAMLFTEQESALVSDAHCRARPKVEAMIARLQNGAPVDGEAGDLERAIKAEWASWLGLDPEDESRYGEFAMGVIRRLSPAPKQGDGPDGNPVTGFPAAWRNNGVEAGEGGTHA